MNCRHRHHTLVRAHLEEGDVVAIHQCDDCGVCIPAIEPDAADPFTLPTFDETLAERGYTRLVEQAFGYTSRTENVTNFAKGVRYATRRPA
jgi:hypothetical protein